MLQLAMHSLTYQYGCHDVDFEDLTEFGHIRLFKWYRVEQIHTSVLQPSPILAQRPHTYHMDSR